MDRIRKTICVTKVGNVLISLTIAFPAVTVLSAKAWFGIPLPLSIAYVALIELIFLTLSSIMARSDIPLFWRITFNVIIALASLFFPAFEQYQIIQGLESEIISYQRQDYQPVLPTAKIHLLNNQKKAVGANKKAQLERDIAYYMSVPERIIWTDSKTGKGYNGAYFLRRKKAELQRHEISTSGQRQKYRRRSINSWLITRMRLLNIIKIPWKPRIPYQKQQHFNPAKR